MKRIVGLLLIVVLLATALPAAAQSEACSQKQGTWNPQTGRCEISAKLDFEVSYPLEVLEYPFATQAVDVWLFEERAFFLGPILEYGLMSSPGPLTKKIEYEVVGFAPSVMSINFRISEYTGGAHPNTYFKTFTFDLASEQVLDLESLFQPGSAPLQTIAPLVQDALRSQLGDALDEAWMMEGTAPVDANYANWVLTPDALVFYFPPYQVAAYAAGPQIVSVPLSALADVLEVRYQPTAAQ